MCFQSLIDEEETTKPTEQILRQELPHAARDGLMAAAIVLVVLAVQTTPVVLIAASMGGAFLLGMVLHQIVLVTGLGVRRLLVSDAEPDADSPADVV